MAFSVYAKRNTSDWVALRFWDQSGGVAAWFNVNTGSVGTVQSGCTATIQSIGSGWFRCIVTRTINASIAFNEAEIQLASADNSNDATAGDSLFIWGADLRIASDASLPYQRVVTASDYADVQAPRYLTFDGVDDSLYTVANLDLATVTSDGQARRNLLTNPTQFDAAAWTATGTSVTANTTVAPNGTTTADTITASAGAGVHYVVAFPTQTAGQAYTFSLYVKAGTTRYINIGDRGDAAYHVVVFDTQTATFSSQFNATGQLLETLANGWWRISCTFTRTSATGLGQIYIGPETNGSATTNPNYTAAGTETCIVYGAQLELGSTATAFQDVGTDKMTVVTGVRKLSDAASTTLLELSATAGSNNGSFAIYAPGSTASPDFYWRSRGTATSNAASNAFAAPVTAVLTALGSISEDIAVLRGNGVQVASSVTDQGAGTYGTYVFFIGRQNNTSFPYNGRIYQLIVRGAQTDTATVQQTERFVAGKTGLVI